jgi:uncharacterized protein (DUF4415 family)
MVCVAEDDMKTRNKVGRPDAENPEWSSATFKKARPAAEVFPTGAFRPSERRHRGPQKAQTFKPISLRLPVDTIDQYRSTGPGWQSRMREVLVEGARLRVTTRTKKTARKSTA